MFDESKYERCKAEDFDLRNPEPCRECDGTGQIAVDHIAGYVNDGEFYEVDVFEECSSCKPKHKWGRK